MTDEFKLTEVWLLVLSIKCLLHKLLDAEHFQISHDGYMNRHVLFLWTHSIWYKRVRDTDCTWVKSILYQFAHSSFCKCLLCDFRNLTQTKTSYKQTHTLLNEIHKAPWSLFHEKFPQKSEQITPSNIYILLATWHNSETPWNHIKQTRTRHAHCHVCHICKGL